MCRLKPESHPALRRKVAHSGRKKTIRWFIEPKRLYNGPFDGHPERPIVPWSAHPLGDVPDDYYSIPLGTAAVRREGDDLTVLASGTMVYVAEAAADETGVDAEIIDLRTLLPLDTDTIIRSVRKTGRCVIVHEATRTSGFGAELARPSGGLLYHMERPSSVSRGDTPYAREEWDTSGQAGGRCPSRAVEG